MYNFISFIHYIFIQCRLQICLVFVLKDEMERANNAGCITSHPGYEEVCLNEFVLIKEILSNHVSGRRNRGE